MLSSQIGFDVVGNIIFQFKELLEIQTQLKTLLPSSTASFRDVGWFSIMSTTNTIHLQIHKIGDTKKPTVSGVPNLAPEAS